ncbi:uncharacterized protein LOC108741699 [Agrilus planipennis]|uniref:Uncharacterized protein LOC108741699 n=1 Tax=Agrilus planipennis TaxID=224129 RepID=A0A1W4XH27_AGRPL|nr:uncharacterized protein LOC108741699 [Agrilus planipennis]
MRKSYSVLCHFVLIFFKVASSLKDVTLILDPEVVQRYHHCTLRCTYNDEGADLYTVKFFRGIHEFYRFTPSESPNTKVFPVPGINVDINNSSSTQVVLRNIDFQLSGNFTCEVTTDFLFSTGMDTKTMTVVELPKHPPTISVGRGLLDYGLTLHANCSSPPSRPPATLKFLLNNMTVARTEPIPVSKFKDAQWSDLILDLPLSEFHFSRGRLFLVCVAEILDIYKEVAELRLDSAREPVPERVSALNVAACKITLHPSLFSFVLLSFLRIVLRE